jgi:hypothetical protein
VGDTTEMNQGRAEVSATSESTSGPSVKISPTVLCPALYALAARGALLGLGEGLLGKPALLAALTADRPGTHKLKENCKLKHKVDCGLFGLHKQTKGL